MYTHTHSLYICIHGRELAVALFDRPSEGQGPETVAEHSPEHRCTLF